MVEKLTTGSQEQSESEPREGFVIVARGQESIKLAEGKLQRAIPFVGADRPGKFSSLGVGVILPDSSIAYLKGTVIPHNLIQSWRAMKILEQVDFIESGTLFAALQAGSRDLSESNQHIVGELAVEVGRDKFAALRARVLEEAPTTEELVRMISALEEDKVEVDCRELRAEVREGRLAPHPLIDRLIREGEEKVAEMRRKEEELKTPLPPEESLALLFKELGIQNMIIGGGAGLYGDDWGHVDLDGLETMIRRDSRYSTVGERLWRTTRSKAEFLAGKEAEIENPWVLSKDGTRYTFLAAKFEEGIKVTTRIEPRGEDTLVSEFTVPQLREMLAADLTQKPTLRQRVQRLLKKS